MTDDNDKPTIVVPMRMTANGIEIDASQMTPEMRAAMESAMQEIAHSMMGREIKKWVTPQIAHEVLSVYGDERATPPSLATGALIALIRTCNISDDDMLENLNQIEDFHGYVLAVATLAERNGGEAESGMAVLRAIAGLLNDWDRAEMAKMQEGTDG